MGIWIRSQDKYKNLCSLRQIIKPTNGKFYIFDISDKDMWQVLGIYSTEEQALKILDEINNIIKPKAIFKYAGLLNEEDKKKITEKTGNIIIDKTLDVKYISNDYFYQMPSNEEDNNDKSKSN